MRTTICLLFILLFSCDSNNIDYSKYIRYDYSWDSLISPKVFIYYRVDSPNLKLFHYMQAIKGKDSILIISALNAGEVGDSNIYGYSRQRCTLKEAYLNYKNRNGEGFKISKGEIIKNVFSKSGLKLKEEFTYPFDKSFVTVMEYREDYDSLGRTKFKDSIYNCAYYTNIINCTLEYNGNEVKSYEKISQLTYAKGFGVVQYTMMDKANHENYVWRLDSIINYKEYKK